MSEPYIDALEVNLYAIANLNDEAVLLGRQMLERAMLTDDERATAEAVLTAITVSTESARQDTFAARLAAGRGLQVVK